MHPKRYCLKLLSSLLLLGLLSGCQIDKQDRWQTSAVTEKACTLGETRCFGNKLETCQQKADALAWAETDNCGARGFTCVPSLSSCRACSPGELRCDGQSVARCNEDGSGLSPVMDCNNSAGEACRNGSCQPLCAQAAQRRSNVGCEYWGADLDNANVGSRNVDRPGNAAAQQYAIVVSNIQPDVTATVSVWQDNTQVGDPNQPMRVVGVKIAPMSLFVFKLGPREVDGSPPGEFDTGTHTALTRAAYQVKSNFPVVAYQFNPLENVDVFSNDASLLKPVEALTVSTSPGELVDSYVVLGWPQTIGYSEDPNKNFNPDAPSNLRSSLTIVGTRPNTRVKVQTRAKVIGGGPIAETLPGGIIEQTLDPFDVLNLETGEFGADFTGSVISADGPVVVFSGTEAADVPFFSTLSSRRCCADHLEEQLDPIRTAGTSFVAAVSPSRSRALQRAGALVQPSPESDVFRVLAVTEGVTEVTTSLPPDGPGFIRIEKRGDFVDIPSTRNFVLQSTAPISVGSFSPSHEATGIPNSEPGGDPSFVIIPPIQQFRSNYVFLTPDKYSFDFAQIIAPSQASITLDRQPIQSLGACETVSLGPSGIPLIGVGTPTIPDLTSPLQVYTCQLSFPKIDPSVQGPASLSLGIQNDGVHILEASHPVGLLVSGFDRYVSYGYAGGTELSIIAPPVR